MCETLVTDMYVVAGTVDGGMEYLAFDSASGGYPYASTSIQHKTSVLHVAYAWLRDAQKNLPELKNPMVYSVMLREVDVAQVMHDHDMLSYLTADQKKILKDKLK